MSYITVSDITDRIAEGIDMTPYIMESDEAVNDMAEELGALVADIETAPLHYMVRRYAVTYAMMRMCQDALGVSNLDNNPAGNKYLIQYNMYREQLASQRKRINYEVMTGNVSAIRDRVSSVPVWRG